MPRLTQHMYTARRNELREAWFSDNPRWVSLTVREQRLLHDYFAPSLDFSTSDLRTYRREVTKYQPSLPHQASKTFHKFRGLKAQSAKVPAVARGGHLRVRTKLRPEPDARRVALVLRELARKRNPESRDKPKSTAA